MLKCRQLVATSSVAAGFVVFVIAAFLPWPTFAQERCEDYFRPALIEPNPTLAAWLVRETEVSSEKIRENISRKDGMPGAVIAARTRVSPNYYYHWIRDAGLVIEALVEQYQSAKSTAEKSSIRRKVFEYLQFSKHVQLMDTLTGLGEPKVHVDGTPFNEMWGRPQNDSPAVRAISMTSFARVLASKGFQGLIQDQLYRANFPADSVIKRDLEYTARHWRDSSWDLWEEVRGDHFYTRMVQRRALRDGAELAARLGDFGAAAFYASEARLLEIDLHTFWDEQRGYIRATKLVDGNRVGSEGLDNKHSNLDIAVILGLLHGARNDGFMPFDDPRVQATLQRIEKVFAEQYEINRRPGIPGTAIGRYPEDAFSGADRSGGNPWVLATLAMAEAYYRTADEVKASSPNRAQEYLVKGDTFVERVRIHAHLDGSLNEQIHSTTGFMHSVEDLTWSYAALLTAQAARKRALRP